MLLKGAEGSGMANKADTDQTVPFWPGSICRNFTVFYFCLFTGVTDYLQTEISTSKQKKFSLVTFVDTPGLVDGDMKYPFDVNQAILWLG